MPEKDSDRTVVWRGMMGSLAGQPETHIKSGLWRSGGWDQTCSHDTLGWTGWWQSFWEDIFICSSTYINKYMYESWWMKMARLDKYRLAFLCPSDTSLPRDLGQATKALVGSVSLLQK